MKRLLSFLLVLCAAATAAGAQVRELVWPAGRMPDAQPQQIAAMTDEAKAELNALLNKGSVNVSARDKTHQLLLAGGLSISASSSAIGAAVVTLVSNKTIEAAAHDMHADGDVNFLSGTAYEFIRQSVIFFLDYMAGRPARAEPGGTAGL